MAELTPAGILADLDNIRVTPKGERKGNPQNMRPQKAGDLREFEEREPAGPVLYGHRLTTRNNEKRKFESIKQRNAAAYLATGKFSFKQVAELVEVCPATVTDWMRNAWFQESVVALAREMVGADAIMEQFKAEAMDSLLVLVEIRNDKKAPASVRKSSCDSILDRAMGKPVQRVETDNVVRSTNPAEEVAELQRANEMLRERAGLEQARSTTVGATPAVTAHSVPEQFVAAAHPRSAFSEEPVDLVATHNVQP